MAVDEKVLREGAGGKAVGALRILLEGRADAYEIYLSNSSGQIVEVKDGETDSFKVRSATGVSIRTIKDRRPGFAYSSVLDRAALEDMAERAVAGSSGAEADPLLRFPEPRGLEKHEGLYESLVDVSMEETPEEEKIGAARSVEDAAKGFDPRVKRVRKASYNEGFSASRVVNSNGVDVTHSATYYSASIAVVAEEGEESQIAWEVGMGHRGADVLPEDIGRAAAERAVGLLGSREIESVRAPAVLENTVVLDLLGTLATSLKGDNVIKGKSMLSGKLEKKIFSDTISLYDDGLLKGGWSSSEADGEGVSSERTVLIERGELLAFLYDTYWGDRAGTHSTGNSVRGGFTGVPTIGTTNLFIEKGEKSLEALFKEMGRGLFVTELLGAHTINPVNGEFSLGAQGFWIEDGAAAYPVRGVAISGDLLSLFSKVATVGGDMRFVGSTGAPSLLISELDISGK